MRLLAVTFADVCGSLDEKAGVVNLDEIAMAMSFHARKTGLYPGAIGTVVKMKASGTRDDFVLMPPHEPSARGKVAVRAWFNATFGAYSTVKLIFPTAEITIDHDWAFKHYTFDWTLDSKAGGDRIRDQGNGLYIYHRQDDGSWKIAYDIWNSNEPLTGSD